jgi:membrane-bound lytic murein transglycosylase F
MREPAIYETLKHGYCRGDEAVALVDSIRNYHDILLRLEKAYDESLKFEIAPDEGEMTLTGKRRQRGSASVSIGK